MVGERGDEAPYDLQNYIIEIDINGLSLQGHLQFSIILFEFFIISLRN